MKALNPNTAIAIDGGGIKGLIVATALEALEAQLANTPLIQSPNIKILAGTSTGSIIAGAIALGMTAKEIAKVYSDLGQHVFPPFVPLWLPKEVEQADEIIRLLFKTSLYPSDPLVNLLKDIIKSKTGNGDITLGQMNDRLGPDKSLIFTTVNINERRTHFLKTDKDDCAQWKLWEAILASSSAPVALPVLLHPDANGKAAYYTDGGAGNYGNPGYFAAMEAVTFRGYAPASVTVLSFGTGWVDADNYEKANGKPSTWHGISWAMNAPMLLIGDAARAQSVEILADFVPQGLDFRRFQLPLQKDITSDGFADDEAYKLMAKLGKDLGDRIVGDQYAPSGDPSIDPEGLNAQLDSYRSTQVSTQARIQSAPTPNPAP